MASSHTVSDVDGPCAGYVEYYGLLSRLFSCSSCWFVVCLQVYWGLFRCMFRMVCFVLKVLCLCMRVCVCPLACMCS